MEFPPSKTQFLTGEVSTSFEKSSFLIVPIPYEKTTSYMRGTAMGPAAILSASLQLEFYDEETKGETCKKGIYTLKPFPISKNTTTFFQNLKSFSKKIANSFQGVPFFLGGEHSISQAIIPPFAEKHKHLSVLHFDAHADLRSEYEESPRNHACAMYPISKICKLVQIGIRNVAPEEKDLINAANVKTYLMHENLNFNKLAEKILSALTENVYISIDVDGFDPSVMPGTGTPQPGGFMWYDALNIFKKVISEKRIVGIDIVEVMPLKNVPITEFAAAKLIYKLMGYLSASLR